MKTSNGTSQTVRGKPKKKLAQQISLSISLVTFAVMLLLSLFTVFTIQNIVTKRVMSEFSQIADSNGEIVQDILHSAELSNEYISDYHNKNFGTFKTSPYTPGAESRFYKIPLNRGAYAAENYYVELMETTVKNNAFFDGMGVYFEPHSFERDLENYSVYVYRADGSGAENPTMEYTIGEEYRNSEWYTQALQTGEVFISEPYEEDGNMLVSIASPLESDGHIVGVTLVDVYTSEFSKIKSESTDYKTMNAGVINQHHNFMYNSLNQDMMGKSMKSIFADESQFAAFEEKTKEGKSFLFDVKAVNGTFRVYCNPVNICGVTWWTYTGVQKSDMLRAVNLMIVILAVATVASVGALAGLSTWQIMKKLKPLNQLNQAADSLLQGNLKYDITYSSQDEIGQACSNMREAFAGLRAYIEELSRWMQALENCNLSTRPAMDFKGDFVQIQRAYESLLDNLNNSFQEIKVSADQINIGAEQISGAAQTLSQGSAEQAASVEELSAMISDVTNKIMENAAGAEKANDLSIQVGADIRQSSQYMNDLMEAMDKITRSSQEVNKIIKTIDDIAFQTNILALNAAVEAARAGSAGKGFAVVADEVRNLAGKSAEAAKSTTALIETEIKAVAEGTAIADQTAESLKQVVANVEAITQKVQQINASSDQQSVAVDQINTGATQISAVIQANSATSEESAAASEELAGQANMLDNLVKQFQLREN